MIRVNQRIKTTVAIAALSAAMAAPATVSYAGEGPFERGGKNVFELQREKRHKAEQSATKPTQREQTNQLRKSVEKSVAKKSWIKRVFKPYTATGNS